jgi:hypothetical protein
MIVQACRNSHFARSSIITRRHIWYVYSKKSLVEWIVVHRNRN